MADQRSRMSIKLRRTLADARKAQGLTQVALAKKLGRPQTFISNYERGERRLEVTEFILLARLLGLDPALTVRELTDS